MDIDVSALKSLVREKDLPKLLSLSRATVRRATAAGRFPLCVRIGKCVPS